MAKSMGHVRDSRALSWLSDHRMNTLSKALLCTTLDYVNPVLYPSIDTILCVLLNMAAASATAKISFSVLRRYIIILFTETVHHNSFFTTYNKMKTKNITLSEKFQKFNRKIVEIGKFDIPNTHIHDRSLS